MCYLMKYFVVVSIFFSGVLCAASEYLDAVEKVSLWIEQKYTHDRTKSAANQKLDKIVKDLGTETEKLKKIKDAFPEAFQIEEKALIYQPPVSWRIHSLALGYDIQESAGQIMKTEDISKAIANKNSSFSSTEKDEMSGQHKVDAGVAADAQFSLNPFSWLSSLGKTKVKLSGSYTYNRNSINNTTELWSSTQQKMFSQELSYIEQITRQTNIKNFHLTFTVTIINNSNESIFCDLKEAYIPVYGQSAFNTKAVPYNASEKLEIPAGRNKDVIFRMELDTTNGRALAKYMANSSPKIDILHGGQLRITNAKGKDLIAEIIKQPQTSPIRLNIPGGVFDWSIRRIHTSNKKVVTLREGLKVVAEDIEKRFGKSDIFVWKNSGLTEVSEIPFGNFAKEDKECRYMAFLQLGEKVYSSIDGSVLDQPVAQENCTIWIIDLKKISYYRNVNDVLKREIYNQLKAQSGGLFSKGNPYSLLNLGVCYQEGVGVDKNEKEAVYWYRKAADQGLAVAQWILGVCYQKGWGVDKDEKQAVYWYRKAADQGLAVAQNMLGRCYREGWGVDKDEKQAVYWYRKAADQGYESAVSRLKDLKK